MTLIRSKPKPINPTRINIQNADEVTYWGRHFGISEVQLEALVQAIGPMVPDVREEIELIP